MLPKSFRILNRRQETEDTVTLFLESEEGEAFPFTPGQFNMVYLLGNGEVPISISGDPAKPGRLVHTVRKVGSVTNALCALEKETRLGIRGPYGQGWPLHLAEGKDLVFVVGGLGLAPLRPAIYHVLANRDKYGRVVILYGDRSPERLLFKDDLERWARRKDVWLELTVDRAGPGWTDHVGLVPDLLDKFPWKPAQTLAMVCGPEIMMRAAATKLSSLGFPEEHIYLSLEINMKCGLGLCGHCQLGPLFMCKDGPVSRYDQVKNYLLAGRKL